MAAFVLTAAGNVTKVLVEPGLLARFCDALTESLQALGLESTGVITDDTVGDLYSSTLLGSFGRFGGNVQELRVPPGEDSKSLDRLRDVYDWLAAGHIRRDGLIVAFGGGVVSDLAGFAAATWMRGIPHAVCPTTLEGAIDAAIGGKTAVNLPAGKNLVGAFHTPVFVGVDPNTFATLSPRDVSAGLAESIKHALITDAGFVAWHESHAAAILALEADVMGALVERNIRIKGRVVMEDPFERTGARLALNFGHTIGHALESVCGYRLRHGECVALGMIGACHLSSQLGFTDGALVDRVRALLARFDLPTRLEDPVDADALLAVMHRDKKSRGGRMRFVLLEEVGRVTIHDDIAEAQVREALARLSG